MLSEILLYVDLLVFLAGGLLYGYLAREMLFRPAVLPGNHAIRGGLVVLAFFYLGTLLDVQVFLLRGPTRLSAAGTAWDLLRAGAWLLAFPLINHTLIHSLRTLGERVPIYYVAPGWLTLVAFVLPATRFLHAQSPILGEATATAYPWVVLHAGVNLVFGGLLAGRLAQRMSSARAMSRMLSGMQSVLLGLAVFFVASYWLDPWGAPRPNAEAAQLVTRTAVLAALLFPGFLMAIFVRRDHILRLSLSFRTLRHFLSVLVLVALVMAAGPALGMADVGPYRRMVAWGLFMALFAGVLYRPVADALLRRFHPLRRLMGRDLALANLEDLMDRLVESDDSEQGLLRLAADELSKLLAVEARWLPAPFEHRSTALFWQYFGGDQDGGEQSLPRRPVHRLDPGNGHLAAVLAREELQAVFPVRVDGELAALLGLSVADSSPWGGGLDDGELEAVSLLVRQLTALLSTRRRLESELVTERRLAEQERLGLLGLVAASLAHEVKNPLSSMKILAQALREDLALKDPMGDGVLDLDAIVEQIDRLDLTTREILGVARPNVSNGCNLSSLVDSAIYVIGADAKRRGVQLKGVVEDVGEIQGSPASWQTVIFNMVLNAVHHTPSGDRVDVRLAWVPNPRILGPRASDSRASDPTDLESRDGACWCFEVANPVETEETVNVDAWFEPFVTEGGTGLGLALVARRAKELGVELSGRIEDGVARFKVEGTSTNDQGLD